MDDEFEFAASLLRFIAKDVQSLTEEQRGQLREGSAKLRLVVEPRLGGKRSEKSGAAEIDTAAIQAQLEECKSRNEAAEILRGLGLSKANLQKLTRAMDLPYQKDDNMERLLDRIVESAVGFRLRSQAIQRNDSPGEN